MTTNPTDAFGQELQVGDTVVVRSMYSKSGNVSYVKVKVHRFIRHKNPTPYPKVVLAIENCKVYIWATEKFELKPTHYITNYCNNVLLFNAQERSNNDATAAKSRAE